MNDMIDFKEDTFTFVLNLDQSLISNIDWIVSCNAEGYSYN